MAIVLNTMMLRTRSSSQVPAHGGFLLIVLAAIPLMALPGQAQSDPDSLDVGSFLVASRSLRDPNFDRTVILMVNHNENGALGLILNRPTEVKLNDMVTGVEPLRERRETVWVGGPVGHWQVLLLARSTDRIEGADRILSDVYFTASREVLETLISNETEFRAYAGYAGWGAGQLEGEIDRGSWHVLPGESDMVFDPAPLDLWSELISRGEAQWASLR